jgi:hypothetical protein
MTNILRFLQVFALGTWVGSILFFSFVVAPDLFSTLRSRDEAGVVVGLSLTGLHHLGVVAAIAYLAAGFGLARSARWLAQPAALVVLFMLLLTIASEHEVMPRMFALRQQMGSVEATPAHNPLRVEFDRLHGASVELEAGVLLAGIAALFLTARKGEG